MHSTTQYVHSVGIWLHETLSFTTVYVPFGSPRKIGSAPAESTVSKSAIKEVGFRGATMKGQWVRVRVRVG